MAKNYGIVFCQRVIDTLTKAENKLLKDTGEGFSYHGGEHLSLIKHEALLKKFTREKLLGLTPSYNKDIHGTFDE